MIRDYEEKDFEEIYSLGTKLHSDFRSTVNLSELYNKSYFYTLVYEQDSKVVGFLMYTDLQQTIDIIDIIVEETYRNKKIASCLIDYMISRAKADTVFYLEVAVDNQKAINLYDKFGFDIIHTRKNYYGEKDAYVMERRDNHE